MKRYKLTFSVDNVTAIVRANNEKEALEKYWNDEIEKRGPRPERSIKIEELEK